MFILYNTRVFIFRAHVKIIYFQLFNLSSKKIIIFVCYSHKVEKKQKKIMGWPFWNSYHFVPCMQRDKEDIFSHIIRQFILSCAFFIIKLLLLSDSSQEEKKYPIVKWKLTRRHWKVRPWTRRWVKKPFLKKTVETSLTVSNFSILDALGPQYFSVFFRFCQRTASSAGPGK